MISSPVLLSRFPVGSSPAKSRPVDQGSRNGCALLFATGKFGGRVFHARGEANSIERFAHASGRSREGLPPGATAIRHFPRASSAAAVGRIEKRFQSFCCDGWPIPRSTSLPNRVPARKCARRWPVKPRDQIEHVDLPDPLAPSKARNSPGRTSSEIWSTARISASPICNGVRRGRVDSKTVRAP